MKIKKVESGKTFLPVKVEFTFESQVELDAVASLFNTCCVIDALEKITGTKDLDEPITATFERAGGNPSQYPSMITDLIKKHPSLKERYVIKVKLFEEWQDWLPPFYVRNGSG